jgi:hypothetical protein
MPRVEAKDIIAGKIPDAIYIIVSDRGYADNLSEAIIILTSSGWNLDHIWSMGSFHFGLFKRT